MSHIHDIHTPHIPPIRTIGTTPSGLLICCAFTQGSASAAQPWASWQNPVGIPGGGWGKARPSDSRRGNGDGPTLGVSGWVNWSAPIYAHPIHVHPPFPLPNTKGVVPQSPGLRGSPRYPGCVWAICNNHNVVVPRERMCGLPSTGPVAISKTHDHVAQFAGSGHAMTTSPHGAPAQPLRGC